MRIDISSESLKKPPKGQQTLPGETVAGSQPAAEAACGVAPVSKGCLWPPEFSHYVFCWFSTTCGTTSIVLVALILLDVVSRRAARGHGPEEAADDFEFYVVAAALTALAAYALATVATSLLVLVFKAQYSSLRVHAVLAYVSGAVFGLSVALGQVVLGKKDAATALLSGLAVALISLLCVNNIHVRLRCHELLAAAVKHGAHRAARAARRRPVAASATSREKEREKSIGEE